MYGTDYHYANTRLTETIVYRGAVPVFVYGVLDRGVAQIRTIAGLDTEDVQEVPLEELDVKPHPLGYVNYRGRATYVMRQPKRRDWRQGVRYNTMTSKGGVVSEIPMPRLDHMLRGIYPSLKECLTLLKKGDTREVAWAREWAVRNDLHIIYKGDLIVGRVVENTPLLAKEYQWLEESLRDSV